MVATSPRSVGAQSPASIRAADGGVISADLYGSGDRGVVLAHGGRFDRTSWLEQARAPGQAGPGTIDRVVLLAHMPIAAPEKLQGRKLFIVARDDLGSGDVPRLPAIRAQYEKAAPPKELIVLDGSAHAQFIFQTEQRERLMREILRFLTQP
jgi:hypothetical protein